VNLVNMSSFIALITNPKTSKKQAALCLDNYFGKRQYGYCFPKEGRIPDLSLFVADDYDIFREEELQTN